MDNLPLEMYNSVEVAKQALDEPIRKYVANQVKNNQLYLQGISYNAYDLNHSINEVVADVIVNKNFDSALYKIIKEVLGE